MAKRKNRDARARNLSSQGGRMSLRQRLKYTMGVVNKYSEMIGAANRKMMEQHAEIQTARYAAKWYRERWIWTMIVLIVVFGVVALGLV